MTREELTELASFFTNYIITDCHANYFLSESGDVVELDVNGYDDFDGYVHDIIAEWDYLNNHILANMKPGPLETDGTDIVRNIIYYKLSEYCKFMDDCDTKQNLDAEKVNYKHFVANLEIVKKKGSFTQKLKFVIEPYV
jgi:hypothetical protein